MAKVKGGDYKYTRISLLFFVVSLHDELLVSGRDIVRESDM